MGLWLRLEALGSPHGCALLLLQDGLGPENQGSLRAVYRHREEETREGLSRYLVVPWRGGTSFQGLWAPGVWSRGHKVCHCSDRCYGLAEPWHQPFPLQLFQNPLSPHHRHGHLVPPLELPFSLQRSLFFLSPFFLSFFFTSFYSCLTSCLRDPFCST